MSRRAARSETSVFDWRLDRLFPRTPTSLSIIILLALSIMATTAATLAPQARASQAGQSFIAMRGPLEGYEGDGFYLTFTTNNTSHEMIRVTNATVILDTGTIPVNTGITPLSPGQWSEEAVWIQMPLSESIGLHHITAVFAFQYLDNQTGNWAASGDSPTVQTSSLLVLPSPTTLNLAEFVTALPVSIAFALAGTLVVMIPTIRKTKSSRPSFYSIPLFSLAATFGSTLHLSIVQTATPCRIGIVIGGFPLSWIPFTYPSVGFHGALFCPGPVTSPIAILNPLFFLLDTAFYAVISLAISVAFRLSRDALFRTRKTLRTRDKRQQAS
jgi:hypothetical protein